jgi:tryptophan synthase alpha chain
VSRISDAFARARSEGRGALVVYITAGDPNLAVTRELVPVIARAGADVIELGMPYSDPLADGPIIQAAGQRALQAGTTVEGVIDTVRQIRDRSQVPLLFMTCYNPLVQTGLEEFAARAAAAGLDGVLVSDLPVEQAAEWTEVAWREGLDTVFLVAPTTPPDRARLIASLSKGFVYIIARPGVTGTSEEMAPEIERIITDLRAATDLPMAVGFGIKAPEQVRAVLRIADGAIVGSAVVDLIGRLGGAEDVFYAVEEFVASLARATRRQ